MILNVIRVGLFKQFTNTAHQLQVHTQVLVLDNLFDLQNFVRDAFHDIGRECVNVLVEQGWFLERLTVPVSQQTALNGGVRNGVGVHERHSQKGGGTPTFDDGQWPNHGLHNLSHVGKLLTGSDAQVNVFFGSKNLHFLSKCMYATGLWHSFE